MKKRFLSLLLSLLLVISLCACEKNGGQTEGTTDAVTESEAVTDAPAEKIPALSELEAQTISQSLVGQIKNSELTYQAWPTVCIDEKGTVYAVCSVRLIHEDPFGQICMYKSTDGVKTWSKPRVIIDSPLDDRDPGIVYLGNGKMAVSYFTRGTDYYKNTETRWRNRASESLLRKFDQTVAQLTMEQKQGGGYVAVSEDFGESWGTATEVHIHSPHGPILLANGNLFYAGRTVNPAKYEDGFFTYISKDGGKTWEYNSRIQFLNGYRFGDFFECNPVELKSGRILLAFRGQGDAVKPEGYMFTLYTCYSDDGGKRWSRLQHVDVDGAPPHLLELENGVVVMTYSRRTEPYGIRGVISCDGGMTWGEEITLSTSHSSDLGYPTTVQLQDGSLLTVYYQVVEGDDLPSIFCTKWKLDQK